MLKQNVDAILEEVERMFSNKEISEIETEYITDISDIIDNKDYPKSFRVKTHYKTIKEQNPQMKLKAIRAYLSNYYNITDKAIQKHIYKKIK